MLRIARQRGACWPSAHCTCSRTRGGMVGAGVQRGQRFGRGRRIAQCYGDVAQPALVAAAPDRAAFGAVQELGFVPGEQLVQAGSVEVVACAEVGFVGALGELVPGADQLAVVAAVDAVAHQWPHVFGNGAIVLDGQVGNAAPCVQSLRPGDRTGGTDIDAARAGAAVCRGRHIDRQRDIDVDLADEEPRTAVAIDQAGVLADPAQPGVARQCAFQHGAESTNTR